jgi:DNA-binding LytR/AlgR family response regulator
MRVVIAEDEALARSLLCALLAEADDVEVVGEAESGSEALALAEMLRPDALFMDIDMPAGNGINAALELRGRAVAEIVFVTAHEKHALDAFDLGAADYLLKPVRRTRLADALERLRARLREKGAGRDKPHKPERGDAAFWVKGIEGSRRIPASDIVWIEAARDHVYLHTATSCDLHRATMSKLEEELAGSGLVRVQRSAFVRLDKVSAILRRGKTILLQLENSTRVSVGSSYQARTLELLTRIEGHRSEGAAAVQ